MREPPRGLPPRLARLWAHRVAQAANRRGAGEYWNAPERPGHARYAQPRPGALRAGANPSDTTPVRLAAKGAPPKGGRTVSKAQQKWGFANRMPWAHPAARRGPAYQALPEHKRRRGR